MRKYTCNNCLYGGAGCESDRGRCPHYAPLNDEYLEGLGDENEYRAAWATYCQDDFVSRYTGQGRDVPESPVPFNRGHIDVLM